MSLTVSSGGGGGSIERLAEGSYAAVCYLLADVGMQRSEKYGNSSRKVIIGWEIPDEHVEIDGEQRPRTFFTRYTASLNEKAILRRDLAAWRGREFTEAELSEFDLRNIVGAPCLIQIIHKEAANGNVYANLASIMKLPKGMPPPVGTLKPVVYDIDDSDIDAVNDLPEWIAKVVKQSESYQQRLATYASDAYADGGADGFVELDDSEEDIPF